MTTATDMLAKYLEAEAAGVRGTGIGCFFDDPVRQAFGIADPRWQSVYHFTVGTPISDDIANAVMAQLLCLQSMDPDRPISIYLNSPGGSFTALTAIYDTMRYIKPDVSTVCLGQAASAAAVLLAAGTKGKRFALPNSRILIHQPATEGGYGQSSDLEIQAREILRIRSLMEEMLAHDTGQALEKVSKDIERDKILSAEQAREYGLIDQVLESRKASAQK